MESEQDRLAGSGKAFGLSVAAAALLGTMATSLFGREASKQDKVQQQLEARLASLEESARQSLDQLTAAVSVMQTQAEKKGGNAQSKAANVSRSARKAADEAAKAVVQRARELDREARSLGVAESAHKLGTDVSSRANATVKTFSERSAAVMADAQAQVPGWRNKAAKSWTEARQRSADFGTTVGANVPDVSGAASRFAHDAEKIGGTFRDDMLAQVPVVKDRAARAAHDASELGKTYIAEARSKAPTVRSQVEAFVDDLSEQAKVIAPDVAGRVSLAASRVGESAGALTHQARDRGPSLLESVGQHLTDALEEAQKKARPLVDDALSQVVQVGTKLGEDIVPQVQHRAHDVTDRIESQSHAASASLAAMGKGATERLSHTTEVVEVRSKQTASAAGRGTMDVGALLGWSAAAAGIVYVTFLSDRQRTKVKESGRRIATEIGGVIRDIRGHDGQFS